MNPTNVTTAPSALGQAFTLHGRFALLLACVLAALWLSVAWLNHKDEEHAYNEMRQRSSALVLAFADHTEATFRSSDHIVLQLRRAWLENPKAFGSAIVAQQTLLGDTSIQIAVIDADGYLVYSNLGFASERVFLGDREHFKVHQVGGRADRLFVSRPVKGRVSGKWSIQLTRPIFMADGHFAGVLVLSLDPSYFVRYHQKFALGTQGLTSIVRDTGEIMARNLAHEKFIGTVISTSPVGDAGAGPQGSYRRASQTDGIDRFFSYHHLPQWGLSVRIGLDVDEFLAPVRGQRRAIVLAAAAVTLLLSLLAWLLLRSVARMQTAERAQSTDRQRLADIVWGTGVGTWEWNVQTGETRFNERWAGLIGYTLDELAPVSIATWMQHAHPDDLVASGAALEKHFAGLTEGYELSLIHI